VLVVTTAVVVVSVVVVGAVVGVAQPAAVQASQQLETTPTQPPFARHAAAV
jgi:hypothetical protein